MGEFINDSEMFKGSPNTTVGKKAWSASGTLYTPGVGQQTNGFSLQANFADAPGYYTLEFSLAYPNVPAPFATPLIRALAEVSWAVEGTTNRRLVHITSGAVISGAGQGVVVKLRDDSIVSEEPFPPALPYLAHVTLVQGSRPTLANSQPPLYQPEPEGEGLIVLADNLSYTIPAGVGTGLTPGVALIDIPQDAGVNSVLFSIQPIADELPPTEAQLEALLLSTGSLSFEGGRFGTWLPVPPGSTTVAIRNYTNREWVGTLAFGIEG